MRALLVLVFAIAASGCVGWTKANTALELGFAAEQTLDFQQTSEAIEYGAEENPLIGRNGENMSPASYFLTTTLLHAFVSAALPRVWREAWQGGTLGVQGLNVFGNVGALERLRAM